MRPKCQEKAIKSQTNKNFIAIESRNKHQMSRIAIKNQENIRIMV